MKPNIALTLVVAFLFFAQDRSMNPTPKLYTFSMKTIDGSMKSLGEYKGKVLLLVNVASECGYTPQYKDLEAVYRKYKEKGFAVLGFPANNFGGQEPGTDEQIREFCTTTYGVTFDLFSKISVKGEDQHPLYAYLTQESPAAGEVKWNFQKYLVDRSGKVVRMIPTRTKPTDPEVIEVIEQLIAGQ
jgi:glutathione peroxidase